jgi:parvulin-like peptidyl-prolyl isomerase
MMRLLRSFPLIATLAASTAVAAGPVLVVNDAKLTDTDLRVAREVVVLQLQREHQGETPSEDAVMERTVDQLIDRTLLLQAARDARVTVDPREVAAGVREQRTRMGDAAFAALLKNLGLDEQDYARRLEEQLVVRKFVDTTLAAGITVSEAEAEAYYASHPAKFDHPEEVRLRRIVLRLAPHGAAADAAATEQRAEEIRKRLLAGESMATLAKSESEGPEKEQGGEVGWVRKGLLPADMEPSVWALKPGEYSGVLRGRGAYEIFKVEERRGPGRYTYDEIKPRLTEVLKDSKLADAVDALVKERRAAAKIEALDPAVKTALEGLEARHAASPPAAGKPQAAPPPGGSQHR